MELRSTPDQGGALRVLRAEIGAGNETKVVIGNVLMVIATGTVGAMYTDVLKLRRSKGAVILITYRGDW